MNCADFQQQITQLKDLRDQAQANLDQLTENGSQEAYQACQESLDQIETATDQALQDHLDDFAEHNPEWFETKIEPLGEKAKDVLNGQHINTAISLDNGKKALVAGWDGQVRLLDVSSDTIKPLSKIAESVLGTDDDGDRRYIGTAISLDDDKKALVAGGNGRARLLDLSSGTLKPLGEKAEDILDGQNIDTAISLDDDKKALVAGFGGKARLLDTSSDTPKLLGERAEDVLDGRVIYTTISLGKDKALVAGGGGRARLLDLSSDTIKPLGEKVEEVLGGGSIMGRFINTAISLDNGSKALVAGGGGAARLLDIDLGIPTLPNLKKAIQKSSDSDNFTLEETK